VTHHRELYIYNIPVYILWVLIGSDLNFCPNDMQRYKQKHHFVRYHCVGISNCRTKELSDHNYAFKSKVTNTYVHWL
jgi:hypothetical protein